MQSTVKCALSVENPYNQKLCTEKNRKQDHDRNILV